MTGRLGRLSAGAGVGFGLEAWLIGTPAELDAGLAALADLGQLVEVAPREPLAGTDRGRCRTYALIRISTPLPAAPQAGTDGSPR